MPEYDYIFVWGNTAKRANLKGERCRVIRRIGPYYVLIEFEDGKQINISRSAIRKVEEDEKTA